MEGTPFSHKEYLRRTSAAAMRQIRSVQRPLSHCLAELDAALTRFPVERGYFKSAMNAAKELDDRILAAQEALPDQVTPSLEPSIRDLSGDECQLVDRTCQLLAYKAQEIAYWRYLLLVCELADLSDLRPLYEASLAEAEHFEGWLRRAFETLAVNQLQNGWGFKHCSFLTKR